MEEDIDFLLKVVLIGDSGVGKTVILKWYTDDVFLEDTKATIGVDFQSMDLNIHGKMIKA